MCGNRLTRIDANLEVFKIAFAAGVSWMLASSVTANPYPIFAPLAAILTMQVTIADSVEKGVYRVLGVIFGVTIGGFSGSYFEVNAWSIFFTIGMGIAIGRVFRLNSQIISQIGVSTLLVLEYGRSQGYMIGRIEETMIGAGVAVALNIIFSAGKSSVKVKKTVIHAVARLKNLLEILQTAETTENLSFGLYEARQYVQCIRKDHVNIMQVIQSYRYTPFHREEREKIIEYSLMMNRLEHISFQIRGIARSLVDLSEAKNEWKQFSPVIHDVQICLNIFTRSIEEENNNLFRAALIMAVRETRLNFSHCFLSIQKAYEVPVPEVGAIFSDLGRILDELEDKFPDLNEKDTLFRRQLLKIGSASDE
ncbi:FUSC family protein [Anaerosinus massiliensis]|uniref:FUSC family protein n=1 Tax=Massilibacillus massiliensis TaxID=1806837 RepID=UPI000DA5EBEA|nr:aromatic acid exporter family protein [Massilibacillus massiliensis]